METFSIKSIYVQDLVMIVSFGLVVGLFISALLKRRTKQTIVFLIWIFVVLWFFNSSFFGFSEISIGPKGIDVSYGFLSFKDTRLPVGSPWKIHTERGGLKKMKRLYSLEVHNHRSMRVRGGDGLSLLQEIGRAIEAEAAKTPHPDPSRATAQEDVN